MTGSRTKEILDSFCGRRVLVVGDLMLDRYVYGDVDRISPEAPVPVVRVTGEQCRPGGAANVALNIQSLGGQAVVAGIVGKDEAAGTLLSLLAEKGIDTSGVLASDVVKTVVKTRVLAERQQVVRIDRECEMEATAALEDEFAEIVGQAMKGLDGVVIEDYGKGALTQKVVDVVLAGCKECEIPSGFDPKDNHELNVRGVTLVTPNIHEACAAAGAAGVAGAAVVADAGNDKRLVEVSNVLRQKWDPELLVITMGAQGMYLLGSDCEARRIQTKAREVFDVSGAGDTVIATALLALASGCDHQEAAVLANAAAGVVVGKVGTAPCTPAELLEGVRL